MMTADAWVPATFAPGLFGKIPTQGDFVRINAGDPVAQEFLRWLQEGYESVHRFGNALPAEPICFFLASPVARNVLIGVLVPSRDQVGRVFPLAVFAPVEATAIAAQFPLVPLAFSRFLTAAAALLAAAPTFAAAQLVPRLNSLPIPNAEDWRVAEEQRKLQLGNSSASLLSQFSAQSEADGTHYAMRTFLVACQSERNSAPNKARVVLDCPLGGVGPLPWLELAGRILRWKGQSPSFLWTEGPPPRALVALGPMPPTALSYLARPEQSLAVFWPLRTSQAPARVAAQQALSPEQRRAVEDRELSVDALFSQLAR